MRIVIDMQGAQTASRFRGIGRYTLSLSQAIARNRGPNEVILVLNGLFPQSIEPIRQAFEGIIPAEHVKVWTAPGPVNVNDIDNICRANVAEYLREAFIASLQPDVVLISSLFEGYVDNAIVTVGCFDHHTLVCTTVYDFIPLLNPEQYLTPHPAYETYYRQRIEAMQRADLCLSISDSSRGEAIEHLAIPSDKIINISAACDSSFRPQHVDEARRHQLLDKWRVSKPFILYTGGADHRKNLPRLIEAFAQLPADIRQAYQLLFAGRLSEIEIEHVNSTALLHDLSLADVRFTGFVSDDELVAAYNLCWLFVFPSWHEGFGLPPLEAMACGAVVIASDTSSLPEVMGLEAAMFNPLDVESIKEKLLQALTDRVFREQLVSHGLSQSKMFSWDLCAQTALRAFECEWQKRLDAVAEMRPLSEIYRHDYARLVKEVAANLKQWGAENDQTLVNVASCIDCNEREVASLRRTDLLPSRLLWRIEGPFDSSYSLALVNREFARGLVALGHDVALHSAEGGGDFPANPKFLAANEDLMNLHKRALALGSNQADVLSRFMYPPRVLDMDARHNFLHCYGWEESRFPSDWVQAFNEHLDGMTVMSQHVAKLLMDSGVRVPIAVTGLGVDHWERVEVGDTLTIQAKTFRFLHVSSCFPRKGIEELLRAYGLAFRASDDVTLVIKTFANPHNQIHQWLSAIRTTDANFPDVLVLESDYSDSQLKSLYAQCQSLVAPSKAEGFGLPLAEAMLSGLAVITTGWSGQLDFCTSETAWLVEFDFVQAKSHFDLFDSVWAQPNVHHLARKLIEVHQSSASERAKRAGAGRQLLLAQFTWKQVAQRSEQALRKFTLVGKKNEPRIAWVSSWNTRCGIASYSQHMLEHMPADVQILASHTDAMVAGDDDRVVRCWHQGDDDSLVNLAATIDSADFDILVIQFNYGFFDLLALAGFVNSQIDAGRTVVTEMHSTTDPMQVSHKKIIDLVAALNRCDRVIVHSVADLNRLKTYGLVANVVLLPLGIIERHPGAKEAVIDRPFRIASYGYFLPHKGLLELIDAVVSLRDAGVSLELTMVNAQYPAPVSAETIAQARTKIAATHAQDQIVLRTDYLDDAQSLGYLSDADLIVFPYQKTGESASAAVRFGIASGVAVAVTPLGIFDDVRDAVHFLPGTSVEHISEGIDALMRAIQGEDASMVAKAKDNARWLADHRYAKLGIRLAGMLAALHFKNCALNGPRS